MAGRTVERPCVGEIVLPPSLPRGLHCVGVVDAESGRESRPADSQQGRRLPARRSFRAGRRGTGHPLSASDTSDREYDFALILTGVPELSTAVEDGLFQAGCDDATLSMQYGSLYLEFSRAAPSLKDAILSAIRDVRKAGVGADVWRVDSHDLVSPSEIARRIGRTRQLIHQYITGARGPGGFPAPD